MSWLVVLAGVDGDYQANMEDALDEYTHLLVEAHNAIEAIKAYNRELQCKPEHSEHYFLQEITNAPIREFSVGYNGAIQERPNECT